MKPLTHRGTILILIFFSLTNVNHAQSHAAKAREHQQKQAKSKQVSQPAESETNHYCPDKDERGKICSDSGTPRASCSPLIVAAEAGDLNTVRGLLDRHVEVNAQGPGGHTALTLAAVAGHLDVVKALLGAGSNPNTVLMEFHFGVVSALGSAMNRCNKDWLQIMDAMIAAGAEVNPREPWGPLPLMHAIKLQDLVIIKALLTRGADVNLKGELGFTPLMMATLTSGPSVPVVKLLLSAGADAKAQNNEGDTALTFLYRSVKDRKERHEISRLLKQAGP